MTEVAPQMTGEPALIKIDIGCGSKKYKGADPNKPEDDWIGMDCIQFPGVDRILDIGKDRWPFEDGSVSEAYTSHFVEHLHSFERIDFANELYRVLVPGGKCTLIVPHWGSCRAYGDPTHRWPPVSEFWFYYLSRDWRAQNAPHTDAKHWYPYQDGWGGFDCDFEVTWGYGLNPMILSRNQDFQQFAMMYYKEAIWDIHATLTKKG